MSDNNDVYFPPADDKAVAPTTARATGTAQSSTNVTVTATIPPTNTMAVVGLVLSILGFFSFITAIPGVILGHIALKQIPARGEGGRGLAVAALTIGYIVIGLGVLTGLVLLVPLLIILIALAGGGH